MNTSTPSVYTPEQNPVPLIRWIWRSYFRASLIPLLLVEVALIVIYFASNAIATRENIETVRKLAEEELTQLARREARGINQQLKGIAQATDYLRHESVRVMVRGEDAARDDPARFAYSTEGAYYSTRDSGGSAVFYSGFSPVGKAEREKAMRSAGLDPAFKGIQQAFPLIVQVYYNSRDSLNRIYPYFDVISQYAPHMDIPSFNFYYEADAAHNPKRSTVWTDVYVDPAGQGWMASCIAPVYRGDFLEGVVGSDVTVGSMISDVLNLNIPWSGYGMLVSREGTIIAMSDAGNEDWGISGTAHVYDAAIRQDTFKPEQSNLFKRADHAELTGLIQRQVNGIQPAMLAGKRLVSWATIPETGWKLLIVAPEENIYRPAQALADKLNRVALLMVLGMALFYFVFFIVLYRRARVMSRFISEPLRRIDNMIADIAGGSYRPGAMVLPVAELDRTVHGISRMAEQLDTAWTQRDQALTELQKQKQHLQSVFDLSPDAFIATDAQSRIVLVNPTFLAWTATCDEDWLGMHKDKLWKRLLADTASYDLPKDGDVLRIEMNQSQQRVLLCAARDIYANPSGETLPNYAGSVIYMRDISREEELIRMKSEFLALAAHELRTPLTSIYGYSELLLRDKVTGAMRDEALQIIYSQSRWLVKIINDLVDLSRLDAKGKRSLQMQALDCADLVRASLDLVPPFPERDPVALSLLPDVEVCADPAKFQQALVNVLDNAYKYSTDGEVGIEMLLKEVPQQVGIRVSDHGMGMTSAQLEHVYDRFWRADNSGNTPGTGLGMSLTREIMVLLNGSVEIESSPGVGTKVTLWLPRINK